MKPDALLMWMRRHQPEAEPVCPRCDGTSGHPLIDGLVCLPCIYRIGRLAGDPGNAHVTEVAIAWEEHEDVVELRACSAHVTEWAWIGWTADPDITVGR